MAGQGQPTSMLYPGQPTGIMGTLNEMQSDWDIQSGLVFRKLMAIQARADNGDEVAAEAVIEAVSRITAVFQHFSIIEDELDTLAGYQPPMRATPGAAG